MLNNIQELFISEYFLYRSVAGRLVGEPFALFKRLGEIFLLDEDEVLALYGLTDDELVRDIATYADYRQFCRIRKYDVMLGADGDLSSALAEIIAIKGAALGKANDLKMGGRETLTDTAAFRLITDCAAQGTVAALRILGFIQCEGTYGAADVRAGQKNLEKAAQWNNVEGILSALFYDVEKRQINIDRLYTVAAGTVYQPFTDRAERKYGLTSGHSVFESVLLNKAFAAGTLKAECYSSQHARFVFSSILLPRDKERTMFGAQDQTVSDIADLPLKLEPLPIRFDGAALRSMPIKRDKESDRIARCLDNSDLRTRSAYRPLCICADAEYIRKVYARALHGAFPGAHVEYIDIAGLDDYDFEPTSNNVFVRSCDEDSVNIFFMSFTGSIREHCMNEAVAFLHSRSRKKFCLLRPGVVIDLGSVLPICFCDKANAKSLKACCDVVTVAPADNAEKRALFEDMLAVSQRLYGMSRISLDECAAAKLVEMTPDRAAAVIDEVSRFNRHNAELVITEALITECAGSDGGKTKYGFGGSKNEI